MNHQLNHLFTKRLSPYIFDAEKPVSNEALMSCFEAARSSPSSYNDQPWHFIYAHKNESCGGYKKLFDALIPENRVWAATAPVLGIVAGKRRNPRDYKPNPYTDYDCGQAMAYFTIQAMHLGLFVHQMGGFDRAMAAEGANVPADLKVIAMFAVGFRLSEEARGSLSNDQQHLLAEEARKKPRNALDSIAVQLRS